VVSGLVQRIESAEIRAADHICEAANEGILLTPIKRSDGRPGRNQRSRQMTNESTNLKVNGEMRALSAVELDAVSGGARVNLFNITVAGMHIMGGYDPKTGDYSTAVIQKGVVYQNHGKV
jgi:hypothetical protein